MKYISLSQKSMFFSLFYLLSFSSLAQECRISISIDNFTEQEIYVAQYYGDKPYLMDTLQREANGKFFFQEDEKLDAGMYFLVLPPERQFVQFLIGEKEQQFTIMADKNKLPESIQVNGSRDNDLFYTYLTYTKKQQGVLDSLREKLLEANDDEFEAARIRELMDKERENMRAYNLDIAARHPNTVTAALLKAEVEPEIPEFEGEDDEDIRYKRFYYRRDHYFDNAPLDDNRLLRSPVLYKRVSFFLDKMTPQNADSLSHALNFILDGAFASEENFQFFLINYLNKYAQINILGLDAVFVHLVDRYVSSGKSSFLEEEARNEVIKKASRMKPTLMGKQAPEITVYDENDQPVTLYDIDANYTVMIFWRPGCSTCQKSMPFVNKFYDAYKDKGVKVVSVCTEMGEKATECWPYVEQKGMKNRFINTYDPRNRSRFYQKYDVRTTPKILVLDKNKEILINRIGAEQLGEILDRFLEKDSEENENK
jgi:thiol-disulfide isomerase/thioredoxin